MQDGRVQDGRVRVQVSAKPEGRDAAGLHRFVEQVRGVAPGAGGSAVTITETAATIVGAFRTAAIGAVVAIAVLLLIIVRRPRDVALVMGALLASALLTVPVAVLLPLPLNFANIVALPLLLGVGVSFNIYFVLNRSAGATRFLGTATARAVLFSALTTATAFGSLAASRHPGTASMGALLLWSLGATLLVTFVLLPVVLAWGRGPALVAMLAIGLAAPARADTLVPPAVALQGGAAANAVWRFDAPVTATGSLTLEWTDTLGRVVERRRTALDLRGVREVAIPLDMRRALAMENRLAGVLQLTGQPARHAEVRFIARPPAGWTDWHAIMWQGRDAAAYRILQTLGVGAGKAIASRAMPYDPATVDQQTAPLIAADSRWYVENIATDFYANYHRWRPDHPSVTWLWDETRRRQRENLADPPGDPTVNFREPSLSDPAWIARIQERLRASVRHQAPFGPYFYNLADEAGIADLAAAWDFDFSPVSLAGFRVWLRTQYRDIAALNRQWGASFAAWDAVIPPTTTQAMTRTDRNWSGWADFKAWMDIAFARALRAGTDAVHAADPTALAGIGGAQIPGWGGYDYGLLVTALDVIEPYNEANNVEIARSLNPALVLLSTSAGSGPAAAGQLWRAALLGSRGLVVWDENSDFLAADGTPGPRGLALAPTIRELAGGIGAQLIASTPHFDQVAILYSQASFRTQWMLARLKEGSLREGGDWTARDSETEWNFVPPHRAARQRAARLLSTLGAQPRWLTGDLVAGGALRPMDKNAAKNGGGLRLLVLPEVIALSDAEAAEIRGFVARGGTVLMMGEAGRYDGRSRLLQRPQLADLAPASATAHLPDDDARALPVLAALLTRARVQPAIGVAAADGAPHPGIETRLLRNGGVILAGLQRTAIDGASDIVLTVPPGHSATDLRRGIRIAESEPGRLRLRLAGAEPMLLALSPARLPSPTLAASPGIRAGDVAVLRLGLAGPSPATAPVLRVDVTGPDGAPRPRLSGNVVLRKGAATWLLPLAASDPPGVWQVRLTDMLSGATDRLALPVLP